jgi:hypothetical protein
MMKKFSAHISHWLPALAILALVACKKEPVNVSPDYDPETNTVKTQLTLNVSTNSPSTKMPASTAQVDGNGFRGMDKVHLLTYSLKYTCAHGDYFMYKPDDESSKATRDYDLGSLLNESDITKDNNSRTVELAVPLSVNAVMLYGMASKTGSDDEQGATVATGSALGTSIASLSFQLQNRLKNQVAEDGFTGFGNLMAQVLTTITNAELSKHTYGDSEVESDTRYAFWWPINETSKKFATRDENGEPFVTPPSHPGYEYHTEAKVTWQGIGDLYLQYLIDPTTNLSPLGQVMGRAFVELTTIRTDATGEKTELRAGDASSLLRTIQDLAEQIERSVQSTPTSWKEEVSRLMAVEVKKRIQLFLKWEDNSLPKYRTMGELLPIAQTYITGYSNLIGKYASALQASSNGEFFPSDVSSAGGFPVNLNLPRGAAIMTCARSNAGNMVFSYLDAIPAYGMKADPMPIKNYRFPAELIYWANTAIYVSDKATDKLPPIPHTVTDWANPDKWSSDWTPNGTISSTTRSVALMKQVNYGTALMKSTVQVTANPLLDNKHGIFVDENNNEIPVGSNSFKVTGVFIGGVADVVGWDFTHKTDNLPEGMTSNPFDKMIYDKVTDDIFVSTSVSNPIYTLVWDSYRPHFENTQMTAVAGPGTQDDQVSVYVALELVNNTGKDFWGELNLIRNGGTFYLVGKLDIKADEVVGQDIEFPDERFFHYPPFYDDGQTIKVKRVFMQDYMTNAKFQIGENSLQHAYMTIPDLRSSQISLGLSVDVDWQKGLDFTVLLGGATQQ